MESQGLTSWFSDSKRGYLTERQRSRYNNLGCFGKRFPLFAWYLFRKSLNKKLELDDIEDVPIEDESRLLGIQLQREYDEDIRRDVKPNLAKALLRLFKWRLLTLIILDALSGLASTMQTISLGWLLTDCGNFVYPLEPVRVDQIFSSSNRTSTYPYDGGNTESDLAIRGNFKTLFIDALVIVLFSLIQSLVRTPSYLLSAHLGMKCRIAVCHMIYRKTVRLNQSALVKTTTGQMVNIISNDVSRFDEFCVVLTPLICSPLQTVITITLLASMYLGFIPMVAIIIIILLDLIAQGFMGRGILFFRSRTAKRTDARIKLIDEIVSSIKIIKVQAWEKTFKKMIHKARQLELRVIGLSSFLRAINFSLIVVSTKIIPLGAITVYVLMGNLLDPAVTFVSLSFCEILKAQIVYGIPESISSGCEALITCARVDDFLALPEIEFSPLHYKSTLSRSPKIKPMIFNKVSASWPDSDHHESHEDHNLKKQPIIQNLNFSISRNDLLLVVGRVGSGKSSLMATILGELNVTEGCIEVDGSFSYAPQEAWVFPGTVRDNILMGKILDLVRYQEVTRVCSLSEDFEQFPIGDQTLVGDRGVSLSGGQKARLNLARALYHQADIYLLDDPLSAVDARVAKHIFEEAIQYFLRDKTVILATHQLQYLTYATKVLLMDSSLGSVFGTVEEIRKTKIFESIGFSKDSFDDFNESKEFESVIGSKLGQMKVKPKKEISKTRKQASKLRVMQGDNSYEDVTFATYRFFMSQISKPFGYIWFIFTLITYQTLYQCTDVLLSLWTDSTQRKQDQGTRFEPITFIDEFNSSQIIQLYALIVGSLTLFTIACYMTVYLGLWSGSRRLHRRAIDGIMDAPLSFFDFRSIGSIMNRITQDMGSIDEILPRRISYSFYILSNTVGASVVISLVDTINLIPVTILWVAFFFVKIITTDTIVRIKYIETMLKSPLFAHMVNSHQGLVAIRAFRVQEQFMKQFNRYQDAHSSAWFAYITASRLAFFLLDLSLVLTLLILITLELTISLDNITPSSLGLVISITISLSSIFLYSLRQLYEVESLMTSVQRLKELSETPREEDEDSVNMKQIDLKKEAVDIEFSKVSLRYFADEPRILKDLTFKIIKEEKVGVMGRTGAGKSSILSLLFRLYPFEGTIKLNGVDTKAISLYDLRSGISIIPQDPILFTASLRKNLDPLEEHSDSDIWAALDDVKLRTFLDFNSSCNNRGLDYEIHERGANMSIGERQLICMARAILRRCKILVLDEATSNMDPETDEFIQQTIRRSFSSCTVITIAHRLMTVAESDRVLILDSGQMVEFDEPFKLMQDKSSQFSKFIDSNKNSVKLRQKIEETYLDKQDKSRKN